MKTKPTTNEPPPTSTTFAGRQARASYYAFLRSYFEHNGSSRKMSWKTAKKKLTKRSLPEEPLRREEAPSKKGKEPKNRFCAKVISVLQKFFEKPKEGPQFCASVWVGLRRWAFALLRWKGRRRCATHFLDDFWSHLVTSDGGRYVVGWPGETKKKREDLLEWSQHRQVETWYHYSCLFWSCILALKIRHHLHEMCVNSLNIAYNILKTLAASWRLPKPT